MKNKINDILKSDYFDNIYKKLLKKDISMTNKEKHFLLVSSILFLNSNDTKINKLGYRIIVKYSNLFNDYIPLYDVAINLDYIPICHFIEKMNKYQKYFNERFNNILMSSYCSLFKETNNIYFTGEQKELKENFIKNKDIDTLVIAPTSYGKSDLILSLIDKFDKIVIIVPIIALINQEKNKIIKFKNKHNIETNILTNFNSYKNNMIKYICILTQERLQQFIDRKIKFDIAFIDEAHNLLENDDRARTLSECILKLKENNTILKFFTPFLNDPKNLTFNNEIISFEQNSKSKYFNIQENIKTENYYLMDFSEEDKMLKLYDNNLNKTFNIKKIDYDYIQFIMDYSNNKNLIYINQTKNILFFVYHFLNKKNYNYNIDDNKNINKYKNAVSEYIGKDFILYKCLEKGIIFHFGNLPDNIKIYIEHIYKKNDLIKFIVASSTLLEGINIPIENIFMLDIKKGNSNLTNNQFKNLVGRACRLNYIFSNTENLNRLEPNIYLIKVSHNNKKNISTFIKKIFTKDKDKIKNPYLKYLIDKEKENKEKIDKFTKIINNLGNTSILSNNLIKDNIILHIIDENKIQEIESKAIEIKNDLDSKKEIINNIYILLKNTKELFFKRVNNIEILFHDSNINLLSDIIESRIDNNLKTRIEYFLSSIKNIKNMINNKYIYTTSKFGKKQVIKDHTKKEFIEYNNINIDLAVLLLQEFDKIIDFNLQMYFDRMYSYGIVEEELINKIKYRTTNKNKIKIIDNGISFTLADILVDEKYSKFYSVENNEIQNNIVEEMIKNNENDIIVFEMKNYLGIL